MTASVLLIDTMGQRLPSMEGTTVSIEGTNISTVTDSFGHWSLTNIPTGLHTIRYSHAGFGDVRYEGIKFLDTGVQLWGKTFLTPPVKREGYVDSLIPEFSANGTPQFRVRGRALNVNSPLTGTVVLFISTDSTFDQSNPQFYAEPIWNAEWYVAPRFIVPYGLIKELGIASGTKLYFQIRHAGPSDQIEYEKHSVIYQGSAYWTPSGNRMIFNACGPAGNTMTAILP